MNIAPLAWGALRAADGRSPRSWEQRGFEGHFTAAGHYRDGILLAPITARLMAPGDAGEWTEIGLEAFFPARFG